MGTTYEKDVAAWAQEQAAALRSGRFTDLDIEQAEIIRLSPADQQCFAQALLSPARRVPALERAFARRRKLLRPE